jgi:hypothetical protein
LINDKFLDLAKGNDPALVTVTNPPTGMIRWNSASNKFEKYNGTTWADLATTYAINAENGAGSVGSWTPSVGGTATYGGSNAGTYCKVGRVVYIQGQLVISTIGTGSKTTISGLPFNPSSTSGGGYAIGPGPFSNLIYPIVYLALQVEPGTNVIRLVSMTAAAIGTSNNQLLGDGSSVTFGGCYLTDE